MKRVLTDYPGVYYREVRRLGKKGTEKVFYVTYKENGKKVEQKVGRQFKDDMTPARASAIRGELIEGKRLTAKEQRKQEEARKKEAEGRWTIDRLAKEYFLSRPEGKSRKIDQGRYSKHLKTALGGKEPKDIAPLDVDRIRLKLLKTKSPQTVKHVLNLLGWIIHFGVKKRLCPGLPFHVPKPTVNNLKTEDLTQEQLSALLKAMDQSEYKVAGAMMRMALFTGMRRGEIFKLRWEHVSFERGFITLKDPKGGPDQKIPMNEGARQLLNELPKGEGPYVFPGRMGEQRKDIHKLTRDIADKAGIPKTFRPLHGLRHVYASMLASSGKVDLYTLQKLLTHKDPRMTQRYAHLRDEALKKASNLAGDLVTQALNEAKKETEVKQSPSRE